MDLQLRMVTSALITLIRISGLFSTSWIHLHSWFHKNSPGFLNSFGKISGQHHQCGQHKSLHHNVIIIITPHSFTCKISPEATAELAASLKQHMGIYSITSLVLSSHRGGKHTQSRCRISLPSNVRSEHMPQHMQTEGIWTLSRPLFLKMYWNSDNPVRLQQCCSPKKTSRFASWQTALCMLHWPYSLCKAIFNLIHSGWNNLHSTAVTRCKQPPTRLF